MVVAEALWPLPHPLRRDHRSTGGIGRANDFVRHATTRRVVAGAIDIFRIPEQHTAISIMKPEQRVGRDVACWVGARCIRVLRVDAAAILSADRLLVDPGHAVIAIRPTVRLPAMTGKRAISVGPVSALATVCAAATVRTYQPTN
eukprot:SAG31_NODE_2953_length_4866_cov_7.809104_7_plen_145_part_00